DLPRISSAMIRTLRGCTLTYLAIAFTSIFLRLLTVRAPGACRRVFRSADLGPPLGEAARVSSERPRRSKLAKLVPDHVLGHKHRHVLPPVVNGERVSHHVGRDSRPAAPGLDQTLLPAHVQIEHLLHEVRVHKKS